METKHLCDSCKFEFNTCDGKNIIFGIDKDKSLRGEFADRILECEGYKNKNGIKDCDKMSVM
jgi:hypothetical protein